MIYENANPTIAYPVIALFPIHKALNEGRSYYDAIRRHWPISDDTRLMKNVIAIGIESGISKCAFSVNNWLASNIKNKWYFEGITITDNNLIDKNWKIIINTASGYWRRGNYLMIELDGMGNFKFIRGHKDRNQWYSLKG